MKPIETLATTPTRDGGEMMLCQHDRDFTIKVNGLSLMNSRQHESELELARLGCAHLAERKAPSILIGGLGMGYTLRETLNVVSRHATVVVVELLAAVVEWNRAFLGELNGHPLDDPRVQVERGDIVQLISRSKDTYDAILLDIDNGPIAMTDTGNGRMYLREGITACRRALRNRGCLAVWSADPNKKFERVVMRCGLQIRRFRVPAYKGSKSQARFVWVASESETLLPPGGGEPLPLPTAGRPAGRDTRRFDRNKR